MLYSFPIKQWITLTEKRRLDPHENYLMGLSSELIHYVGSKFKFCSGKVIVFMILVPTV